MGTVNRLVLRTANRTAPNGGPLTAPRSVPHQFWCGTDRGAATKFVRCIDKRCELGRFTFIIGDREPYRTKIVINNKRITVPDLARYGSLSNTKNRAVTIKGSVRFTLLLKNCTVTVALAVKKRYG